MRILVLHNRYRSGDTSGENRVVRDEISLLRDAGHTVMSWEPSPDVGSALGLARAASDAVWSRRAARRVASIVQREQLDVVHVHNLFPALSPAVLRAAGAAGAAVVVTLHNYRYMCLPATLMRDGRPCGDCVGRAPWPGVLHRCYRGSALASAPIAISLTVHRSARSFDAVTRYAAVSRYLADTYEAAGLPASSIVVKPNFARPAEVRAGPGDGFVYVGRLAPEKGVDVLLDAWRAHSEELGPLAIVGSGPSHAALEASAPPRVRFLGDVPGDRVADSIRAARAVLIPSRWEEAAVPRVALEAFASGVPVIASRRGALPEGVVPGENGVLVTDDDPVAWRTAMGSLLDDGVSERLGAGAVQRWRTAYAPEVGAAALERLYEEATARS